MMGGLLAFYGIVLGGVGLLLLWSALGLCIVASGYSGLGARLFGKRTDGTVAWLTLVVLFP